MFVGERIQAQTPQSLPCSPLLLAVPCKTQVQYRYLQLVKRQNKHRSLPENWHTYVCTEGMTYTCMLAHAYVGTLPDRSVLVIDRRHGQKYGNKCILCTKKVRACRCIGLVLLSRCSATGHIQSQLHTSNHLYKRLGTYKSTKHTP
jgi:hypothetical protein